jgi:hypothetical protein
LRKTLFERCFADSFLWSGLVYVRKNFHVGFPEVGGFSVTFFAEVAFFEDDAVFAAKKSRIGLAI